MLNVLYRLVCAIYDHRRFSEVSERLLVEEICNQKQTGYSGGEPMVRAPNNGYAGQPEE